MIWDNKWKWELIHKNTETCKTAKQHMKTAKYQSESSSESGIWRAWERDCFWRQNSVWIMRAHLPIPIKKNLGPRTGNVKTVKKSTRRIGVFYAILYIPSSRSKPFKDCYQCSQDGLARLFSISVPFKLLIARVRFLTVWFSIPNNVWGHREYASRQRKITILRVH